VVDDSPLLSQLEPHLFREHEVRGMVAVQVADLPASELEGKLTTPAVAGRDAWPGGDLLGDLLARCS
jgi:hypothetical protein